MIKKKLENKTEFNIEVEELKNEIIKLKQQIEFLQYDLELEKNLHKVTKESKDYYESLYETVNKNYINYTMNQLDKEIVRIQNERGAGRKSKFTEQQIQEIKQLRQEKLTIKEIAEIFNCSVGLIHKIINEN